MRYMPMIRALVLALATCAPLGAAPAFTQAEAVVERFASSDVEVIAARARGEIATDGAEWTLEAGWERLAMDYRPNPRVDVVRREVRLTEKALSAQLGYSRDWRETTEGRLNLWLRDGFGHFSAVWIDEYHRQQFGTFPGYREARPYAGGAEISLRRPFRQPATFLEGGIGWGRERIAPGYERDFSPGGGLLRGRDQLSSLSGFLAYEGWLSPRLRTRHLAGATGSNLRPPRYLYRSEWIWGPAPAWTVRGALDATADGSRSRALTLQPEVLWEWQPNRFWSLRGRYYRDNGGIEDALATFATAAPALTSREIRLAHTWTGQRTSLRLSLGCHFTRYAEPSSEIAPFLHLYRNRNWLRLQIASTRTF